VRPTAIVDIRAAFAAEGDALTSQGELAAEGVVDAVPVIRFDLGFTELARVARHA
jgi:hypothetical protein